MKKRETSLFPVEYVDPNTDKCPECGGSIGVHLKTCSHHRKCKECGAVGTDKQLNHLNGCSQQDQTAKCKNCGKPRGQHKSGTLNCPAGSPTRIGYTAYNDKSWFQAKQVR
jgi:hypothetical protein